MTGRTGSGYHDDNDFDTIDDIDAAVDAVTDKHVTERFHQLLAESVLTHLSDLDSNHRNAPTPPAGPGYVDAADVAHLAGRLHAVQVRLSIAQAELEAVNAQRAQALYDESCAQARLSRILDRIAKASTASGDPYLETVIARGQELLNEAHRKANWIVATANGEAERIRNCAEKHASLAAGHARGRPQPD